MKIFIDTANLDEIKEIASWGILDGVTTNPTLLAREVERTGKRPNAVLREICGMVKGPVTAEVTSKDAEGIVNEGKKLRELAENICIKIPVCKDGLLAIKKLRDEDIMTNTTLVFSANQALLAAKAGTNFVSPFIGRMDDVGNEGMEIVDQLVTIFDNYCIETEVVVASVRHPMHIVEAALIGADVCTIPYNVILKMLDHPLTDVGIERFLKDWGKIKPK
ncbi:fructose-6-phosphate aldolase [candidate division WOR-3 bacterium JGI_Cruoil_03_44_89]|uniref:Probable transaldolase n=1 Tax=candidate division WOR-3 bacterium JGI_Cruoil_03_44_89 TaxID=1973748 RepID=A0A235BP92_UNCW3|nr:MAG: fructose-6-phosphate aldolase [candidate division WOR-3 bacterium JGI_Cruoil_03_44_89]